MRWLAALGWAVAGGLVVVRNLQAEFPDSRDQYVGVFFLVLAGFIAIGRRVGKTAAGYATGAATLIAVGSLFVIGMAGSGVLVITLFMGVLAFLSYGAATSKP